MKMKLILKLFTLCLLPSLLCLPGFAQPVLNIALTSANSVIIWWPSAPGGFVLQQNADLAMTNWANFGGLVQSNITTLSVTNPLPTGNLFYRLAYAPMPTAAPTNMAVIPAGPFTIGDTLDGEPDAIPASVYISTFYMDTNLVTEALWTNIFIWATNHGYTFENTGLYYPKGTNYPVQTVNWLDCVKWCNARSQQAGLTPVYYTNSNWSQVVTTNIATAEGQVFANWAANGYRLPTEAEWEKAARGGLSGQRFPWGLTIDWNHANYFGYPWFENGDTGWPYDYSTNYSADPTFSDGNNTATEPWTSPVGYFAPNGYGLCDMAGNVNEWCWDWYAAFPYPPGSPYLGGTDPRGPASDNAELDGRVVRGGQWQGGPNYARCCDRQTANPPGHQYTLGFRCVRGH
jgi:formylglycine-generating enzyme required for sulfatase activity